MKHSFLLVMLLLGILTSLQEARAHEIPLAFNYASVYINSEGAVAGAEITVRTSILEGDEIVYSEEHDTETSPYGNYSIMVGEGFPLEGLMEDIDWSILEKKLRIEIAEIGEEFQFISENNFTSVPYAIIALYGEGETGPTGYSGYNNFAAPCEQTGGSTGTAGATGIPAESPWSYGEYTQWYLDGNVGIGTDSPQEKLHVAGNICYTGTATACSDRRYKENIEEIKNAVEAILTLRAVKYEWDLESFPNQGFDKRTQLGLIAQEVEKVLPEAVSTNDKGYKSVEYSKLSALLLESIQEQEAEIIELKSKKESIANRVEALEEQFNKQ